MKLALLVLLPSTVAAYTPQLADAPGWHRPHRPNDMPKHTAGSASPVYYGPPRGDACSGLWPLPRTTRCRSSGHVGGGISLVAADFHFVATSAPARSSGVLERAFRRFHSHIFSPMRPHSQKQHHPRRRREEVADSNSAGASGAPRARLLQLSVSVDSFNETLGLGVNESYQLHVNQSSASLHAHTVWGALHGLETFSQLAIRTVSVNGSVSINSTHVDIEDAPRFPWRGVMIDTSRHFYPVSSILAMIDAISFNRMNVLHWHITDAQSFPLKTKAFPKLIEGAYGGAGSTLHYDSDDVRRIVDFAKDRGIRVVPEIDSPGHSASWQLGYPELGVQVPHDWYSGMVDPTKEDSFTLLAGLFGELAGLFDDEFVHIGCDEVDFAALNQSAPIVKYMLEKGIPRTGRGFKRLIADYIERLCGIVAKNGKTPVAWQEAMDHYGDSAANPTPPAAGLPSNLVIEQWLSPVWNWANVSAITGDSYASTTDPWPANHTGFRALVTDGWYLDSAAGGNQVWQAAYAKEPLTNATCTYDNAQSHPRGNCSCTCPEHNFRDGICHCFDLRYDTEKAKLVLGGEACEWGEHTDAGIVQQRTFPGACAVAERLWSSMELTNATLAAPRLARQRCRMLERGIDVPPMQPGYCI
jgi:hexosaminidase